MSIGTQFLNRVLAEAKKPEAGYKFDRSIEAMKRSLRDIGGENNFADKIAEVMAMVGISGMYLNKPDVRESILEAAGELRTKSARVAAFLALHSALAAFHGVVPVSEAKGTEEQDLEGNAFQKTVEEVLVVLGLPAEMVSDAAKAGVKSGLKRTIAKLRADEGVRAAVKVFAQRAGVKVGDKVVGSRKPGVLVVTKEEVSNDEKSALRGIDAKDPAASARSILAALGVDLEDDKIVRVVNDSMLTRSIKTAVRDAKVKRGITAFLRAIQ